MRCIHCSILQPADLHNQPYKQYQHGAIKLLPCSHCGNYIDKYIEYSLVIILIELLLFRRITYNHILYNTYNPLYSVSVLAAIALVYGVILYTVYTHYIA